MDTLPERLLDSVEQAIGRRPAAVTPLRRGLRSAVFRASFPTASRPGTCIVKRSMLAEAAHLRAEQAGLMALRGLGVPDLLGVAADGTLVMEDIADAITLEDLLAGHDWAATRTALRQVADALGTLHAGAIPRTANFRGVSAIPAYQEQSQKLIHALPAIKAFLAAAGIAPASGFEAACHRSAASCAAPGRLATMTLGDIAPSNILICPQRAVFIDLEFAGVRHAFYDAMFWRCICPFPRHVADAMEAAYLAALRAGGVAIGDDAAAAGMVTQASHRLLWMLSWNMAQLFARDRPWAHGAPSTRAMLVRYVDDAVCFMRIRPHEPAIVATMAALGGRLRERWVERVGEPFPVFRHAADGSG